jgi:hypothetical protein
VPFSKLSRQKAIETCEILIEQRDRQIRRAEAAEARMAEVWAEGYEAGHEDARAVQATYPDPTPNPYRAAARGEGDR